MDTKTQILQAFQDSQEPLSAGQIAEKTGIDRKEVDKVMKKLKTEELIVSPKRCYWTAK